MNARFTRPAIVATILGLASPVGACTGIRIKPTDGSVIYARTLEFAVDLRSDIIIVPRGAAFVGSAPGGGPGVRSEAKYGIVGANALGEPIVVDGMNEKGLAVGIFYFPGYARYQEVGPGEAGQALAPWELATFLLGRSADADEAVAAAREVRVAAVSHKALGFVPPCHYVVHDARGRCVVLEHVGGALRVHDNPLGVITNSPSFDWHLTNLRNYVNLSVLDVPAVDVAGIRLAGLGLGTGMLGLPGDFTPPSRFVRAVAFSQAAPPVATAPEGVLQAFHILNQFDIPEGVARGTERGKAASDYTLWTAASDLKNLRYHFHTHDNRRIRMIDLKRTDLDAPAIKTIPMAGPEIVEDVTARAR
jgi:choloylglycine hydrolase